MLHDYTNTTVDTVRESVDQALAEADALIDGAVAPKDPLAADASTATPEGYNGPYLYALFMQTPIMSDMEWPLPEGSKIIDPARQAVKRIGYLRRGGRVPVSHAAHSTGN